MNRFAFVVLCGATAVSSVAARLPTSHAYGIAFIRCVCSAAHQRRWARQDAGLCRLRPNAWKCARGTCLRRLVANDW